MEVKVCEESQQVHDQVTYLYKFASLSPLLEVQNSYTFDSFREGRSNKSFGTMCVILRPRCCRAGKFKILTSIYSCAAINGIDASIISRANEISSLAARGENLIAACAAISAEEMEALQTAVWMHGAGA